VRKKDYVTFTNFLKFLFILNDCLNIFYFSYYLNTLYLSLNVFNIYLLNSLLYFSIFYNKDFVWTNLF